MAGGSGIAALGGLASLAIYRPYFIGLAGLALVYAFLTAFWEKYRAGSLRSKNYPWGREEVVLVATTLLVFVLILFPYLRGMNPGDGGRTYEGKGSIIHVDQEDKKVTLRHEDVEGVMPAMTMDYEVYSPELLQGLKAGDEVRFHLSPAGFEFVVVEIRKEKKS